MVNQHIGQSDMRYAQVYYYYVRTGRNNKEHIDGRTSHIKLDMYSILAARGSLLAPDWHNLSIYCAFFGLISIFAIILVPYKRLFVLNCHCSLLTLHPVPTPNNVLAFFITACMYPCQSVELTARELFNNSYQSAWSSEHTAWILLQSFIQDKIS